MSRGDRPPENPPVEWFASATLAPRKLDEFLLSPTHPVGKHKARLWWSVFGIGAGDGQLLDHLLRGQLSQGEPEYRGAKPTGEGADLALTYEWEIFIPNFRGPNGRIGPVKTGWALDPDEERPHLSTAYPDVE